MPESSVSDIAMIGEANLDKGQPLQEIDIEELQDRKEYICLCSYSF